MEPDYGSISKTLRVNKTDTSKFQAIILSKSSKYHFMQNLSSPNNIPHDLCKLIWQKSTKCPYRPGIWVQNSHYCLKLQIISFLFNMTVLKTFLGSKISVKSPQPSLAFSLPCWHLPPISLSHVGSLGVSFQVQLHKIFFLLKTQ